MIAACVLTLLMPSSAAAVNEQAAVNAFQYYFNNNVRESRQAGRTAAKPGLSPTMAALEVLRKWDDMSPESRAALSQSIKISERRNSAREISTEYTGICTESVFEDTHPHVDTAHFRVIYKTGAGGSTAAFAQQIATTAETVWSKEITQMGYPEPRLKSDNKMRIYLCDILGPFDAFGFMWPEYEYSDHTVRAHIELDNDFEGFTLPNGTTSKDFINTTVAHEFFHAVQVGMNYQAPSTWLLESTASWIEEEVFPDNFDYYYYVEEKFNNMNLSVDYWSNEDIIGYGSGIFFRYISELAVNPDFIKNVFLEIKAECSNLSAHTWCSEDETELPLIDSLLSVLGLSIEDVYHNFVVSSVKCEYHDCPDTRFPRIGTKPLSTTYTESLPHLSSRVLLSSYTCSDGMPTGVSLKLSTSAAASHWTMTMLKKLISGGWEEKTLTTTTAGDITIKDSTFCSDYSQFNIIISNSDTAGDIRNYSATISVTKKYYMTYTHTFPAGWNLVGVPFVPAYEDPDRALNLYGILQLKLGKYINIGMDPAGAGMAYWSYFNYQSTVSAFGETSNADTVTLSPGWNIISLPRNTNANWNTSVLVLTGSGSINIDAAGAALYVNPLLYTFNPATEEFSPGIGINDGFVMTPWTGFAIYALQPCSLKFSF